MDSPLARKLPVIIFYGVERLRQIGGIMREINRVVVNFAPVPAAKVLCEVTGEPVNLPHDGSIANLSSGWAAVFLYELSPESGKRIGVVRFHLAEMVWAFSRVMFSTQIWIAGVIDKIELVRQKV